MLYRGQESFQSLPRQGTPRGIGYGHTQHDGYVFACALLYMTSRHKCGFGVERVEYGFYYIKVNVLVCQHHHLLFVSIAQLVKR